MTHFIKGHHHQCLELLVDNSFNLLCGTRRREEKHRILLPWSGGCLRVNLDMIILLIDYFIRGWLHWGHQGFVKGWSNK